MNIIREIDGASHLFTLTDHELFLAHEEQEHKYDLSNVAEYLSDDHYTPDQLEAIAYEVRRQLDKYDLQFEYAIDAALDVFRSTLPEDQRLENLWLELADVPFDEDDGLLVLAQDWVGFPKGTDREEIWHWFDENHSKGVYYLLYEFSPK